MKQRRLKALLAHASPALATSYAFVNPVIALLLGVWLVETYRTQFAQEIGSKGIDGLIASLVQRNKSSATAKTS